jgi:Calcineurin-like phosphoesterase
VLSDLHGHLPDWEAFLARTQALERIAAGEEVWLLITGDVPDVTRHRGIDPAVPEDGDVQILEQLMRAKAELGARAERIVYLEGNHDFHLCRIYREVARYHAFQRGEKPTPASEVPEISAEELEAYCAYYREAYGVPVFENNIGPYDMINRLRPDHVRFLESCPIVAVLEGAGVAVTHAGPPRMEGWRTRSLLKAIDRADREFLRTAKPEAYYASPYHQLLNGRFRNNDYTHQDLEGFLAALGAGVLVTGHTPHSYLIDFARRAPLEGCTFEGGLGVVGGRQVVLCSSFGAFTPAHKHYLELDLARPYESAQALFAGGASAVRYLREGAEAEAANEGIEPLPGAEIALGA